MPVTDNISGSCRTSVLSCNVGFSFWPGQQHHAPLAMIIVLPNGKADVVAHSSGD